MAQYGEGRPGAVYGSPPPAPSPAAPPPVAPAPAAPAAPPRTTPPAAADVVRAVPRRGRLGPLNLAQILAAEAALLAVVAAATRGAVPLLIAAGISAVLLPVVFARRQNRWWLEHRSVARDHRRRRAARPDPDAGPVLAALRTVAPGLTVRDVSTPDRATVGVAQDDSGWFSVVALGPDDPGPDAAGPVPLDTLVGVLAAADQPGVVLSLVTHTVPAPSPDVHPASPAGSSYRQLLASAGPVPAYRESSLSVRVDARALAEALHDHTADPEAAAALAAGLGRRVATSLRRQGRTGHTLDAAGLVALLARSCDVEPGSLAGPPAAGSPGGGPPAAGSPGVDEQWTHWRSGRLLHRTYWVRVWPAASGIGSFFAWAATAPAAQISVALVLGAVGGDEVPVRAFLRFAVRPDTDLGALDRLLEDGARRAGAELQALDGEQGPAAYASAPTGGGAG